jgi:hypothetical protein
VVLTLAARLRAAGDDAALNGQKPAQLDDALRGQVHAAVDTAVRSAELGLKAVAALGQAQTALAACQAASDVAKAAAKDAKAATRASLGDMGKLMQVLNNE